MFDNCLQTDIEYIRNILMELFETDQFMFVNRLGGLTNHSYMVQLGEKGTFVVRIPGEGTEELINRSDERISTELACRIGIDAELLYFGSHGEKVTRFIDGAHTLCAADFLDDANLKRVAKVLRKLHTTDCDTHVAFEVFEMAADYERIIRDNAVALYEDYESVKKQIMEIKHHIETNTETPRVPCHNDPLCENWILSADGKMYLIDWEYAGMNDGMWDLADVSIEAGLSSDHDAILLHHYFGRTPDEGEKMRFQANKLYLDFLWSLWGKARVPFDGEPMEQYALERYIRLKQNLGVFCKIFSTM